MDNPIYVIELLLTGILVGLRYSMIALGFVLIYKASGVFNFAQGAMSLFAALVVVAFLDQLGLVGALLAALVAMALVGIAAERVVFRPLIGASPLIIFMATVGVAYILEGGAQIIWGTQPRGLPVGLPVDPLIVGGVFLSKADLISALIAGALVTALVFFFYATPTGLALRALADDPLAARASGIPISRAWAVAWILAGVVATATGVLWGSRIGVHFAMSDIALKALPVLIIGGVDSIGGVILAGIIIGAAECLGEGLLGPLVGGGVQDVMAYAVVLIFLLIRPQGLFGQEAIKRV